MSKVSKMSSAGYLDSLVLLPFSFTHMYSVLLLLTFIPLLSSIYLNPSKLLSTSSLLSLQITMSSVNIIFHEDVAAQPFANRLIWPFAHMPVLAHCRATPLVCMSHLCAGLKSLVAFVNRLTHSLTIKRISEQLALPYFWVSYLTKTPA